MRLEGWHVIVLLIMVLLTVAVIVVGTLVVLWTVAKKRKHDGCRGLPPS
jgi:hypothetical protein